MWNTTFSINVTIFSKKLNNRPKLPQAQGPMKIFSVSFYSSVPPKRQIQCVNYSWLDHCCAVTSEFSHLDFLVGEYFEVTCAVPVIIILYIRYWSQEIKDDIWIAISLGVKDIIFLFHMFRFWRAYEIGADTLSSISQTRWFGDLFRG